MTAKKNKTNNINIWKRCNSFYSEYDVNHTIEREWEGMKSNEFVEGLFKF